jgi:hypothetical protein
MSHDYGFDTVIHSADLLDAVRSDWRTTRPLVEWVADRVDVLPG